MALRDILQRCAISVAKGDLADIDRRPSATDWRSASRGSARLHKKELPWRLEVQW